MNTSGDAPNVWMMQLNGNPRSERYQDDLVGALNEAITRDRTIWLANNQHERVIAEGDRVYLWLSGVRSSDPDRNSVGCLIAVATVRQRPQSHPQWDWQAQFRTHQDRYDPAKVRIELYIECLVSPRVERWELMQEFTSGWYPIFLRDGHIQTTARVEPELDRVLRRLIEGRLTNIAIPSDTPMPLDEAEQRRFVERWVSVRDGQAQLRAQLLVTRPKQCEFTGSGVVACLEAAHILPDSVQRNNDLSNALLLRADVHTLFDRRLIRIDPQNLTIVLHPSLKNSEYAALEGNKIQSGDRLDRKSLQWQWEDSR